jgi:hypothetical protein
MAPVRIKYYGMFWMTRPTYVAIQTVVFIILAVWVLLGAGWMIAAGQLLPRLEAPPNAGGNQRQGHQEAPPKVGDDEVGWWLRQGAGCLFWLGLLTALAEGAETVIVLRKFDRAEALARTQQTAEAARPAPSGGSEAITPGPPPGDVPLP